MESAKCPEECPIKMALLGHLQESMAELVPLQAEGFLSENVTRAQTRKAQAVEQYREHVRAHGC